MMLPELEPGDVYATLLISVHDVPSFEPSTLILASEPSVPLSTVAVRLYDDALPTSVFTSRLSNVMTAGGILSSAVMCGLSVLIIATLLPSKYSLAFVVNWTMGVAPRSVSAVESVSVIVEEADPSGDTADGALPATSQLSRASLLSTGGVTAVLRFTTTVLRSVAYADTTCGFAIGMTFE